jgi:hypothetical protein
MCTHVRQNFWKVSSNSEHHSKPTMNINSQHHNLLGNQISPKSEDFCIWRSFCTFVTMATAAILNFIQPPKVATHYGGYSYKASWSLMKWIKKKLNHPFFVSMATTAKFVQPIPIFLAYLVPLDVDVVPIKFHQFLFAE